MNNCHFFRIEKGKGVTSAILLMAYDERGNLIDTARCYDPAEIELAAAQLHNHCVQIGYQPMVKAEQK